jgi:hypothetical protein
VIVTPVTAVGTVQLTMALLMLKDTMTVPGEFGVAADAGRTAKSENVKTPKSEIAVMRRKVVSAFI